MEVNEPKIVYQATGTDIEKYRKQDYLFPFKLTVGRIAESLVQELFLLEGYQTYKYGLENTYQFLYKQLKYNKSPTAKSLRKSPDLVIFDPTNEEINYAEVKFRSTDCFIFKDSEYGNYEESFPDTYFFIVTPKEIYCISAVEMKELENLKFSNGNNAKYLLKNSDKFVLRPKSIEHFEYFCTVFYNKYFLDQNKKINGSYRF